MDISKNETPLFSVDTSNFKLIISKSCHRVGGNTVQFQNAEHGQNWKIEYLESENYVRILGTARKREIMRKDIMFKNCWMICFKWYTKIIHWTHNLKFIFPYSSSNASTMLWASMEKAWWGCSVMPQFTNAFFNIVQKAFGRGGGVTPLADIIRQTVTSSFPTALRC